MEKLLPCPFCGSPSDLQERGGRWQIKCERIECPTKTLRYKTKEEAIKAWNTRSCYPAEFVEWIGKNYDPITVNNKSYWIEKIISTKPLTTEKLFKLWKEKKDIG